MVEIGPNLKEVLINFMNNNVAADHHPGYELKECFGKILDEVAKKAWDEYTSVALTGACSGATATVKDLRKYPTESGYYWFYDKKTESKRICFYVNSEKTIRFMYSLYDINVLDLDDYGYFIKPIEPIPVP